MEPGAGAQHAGPIAFVLGGGGVAGSVQVGMLEALADADVEPDLILGTSIGAINGAVVAARPGPDGVAALAALWRGLADATGDTLVDRLRRLARTGTHIEDSSWLRGPLEETIGVDTFEELARPFQCVAASIERAAPRWFSEGPLVDAILASSAVPGLFAPVQIGGEHFLDGGLVHSIPLGRAIELGASTIYALQVGRIETPLSVPNRPWEVASVAFEIARRHRFVEELEGAPTDVVVHVLPTGAPIGPADASSLRYRDAAGAVDRMRAAHSASADYLADSA
ncbi:MAG: patatin-like phospholipase family protein [Solirubrobacterales bacterium]